MYLIVNLPQVYPRQARRLITDPVKGIFVPLIVSPIHDFQNISAVWLTMMIVIGSVICDDHYWDDQLYPTHWTHLTYLHFLFVLVRLFQLVLNHDHSD